MSDFISVFLIVVGIGITILLLRLFGAWMLRIDEVIELLRAIRKELKDRTKVDGEK